MKVSVLICNRNYGRFLADAIDSALAQTWKNVEVIVVDDDSSDDSQSVIATYGTRLRSEYRKFGNQTRNVNFAFSISTGQLVVFLDSDDVLYPTTVERYVRLYEQKPFIKASGCLRVVAADRQPAGSRIPATPSPSGDYRDRLIKHGPGIYRTSFTTGNIWARSFLDNVMPLSTSLSLGPDGQLNTIAPLFGHVETVVEDVGDYRVHGRNQGPNSRRFNLTDLKKIQRQKQDSNHHLQHWIKQTGGPATASLSWRKTWRHVLIDLCIARMERASKEPSLMEMISAVLVAGETVWAKRVGLMPIFVLIKYLPIPSGLRLSRSLLQLPVDEASSSPASGSIT